MKLLFNAPERLPEIMESIRHQREAYLRALQRVGAERARVPHIIGTDAFVTALLIDGVELSVRAELAWLEGVAQKLKARYGAPAK